MSDTDLTEIKQRPAHLFKPGQSGNPAGRPKGARSRHSENFLSAFAADFEEHGVAIIERVRKQSPEIYLKLCSDLLPKDLAATLDPSAEFRACDTAEEIMLKLAEEDLQGNLEHAKWMYESLLKIAAERAEPVS